MKNAQPLFDPATLTVLSVRTDQSGIVGLVRTLPGLGMTIQ